MNLNKMISCVTVQPECVITGLTGAKIGYILTIRLQNVNYLYKEDFLLRTNILVVDDEVEIADLLELYLNNEGFTVHKFYTAKDALTCINTQPLDLALLDVMLPDGNGFTLCRIIRESHNFPVIMLTARDEEIDKINGLTLGADDYITKPFRPLELIARVKAQLRRYTRYNTAPQQENDSLVHRGLYLNANTHECTLDGEILILTPTEFSILRILCEQKGNVVSAEQLSQEIWGEEYYSKNTNSIATHIRHLREKMNDSAEHPKYIKTVWGVGYKIER